jgi:hypothetical protein
MIVKMTILGLLGSSDDKEKIGVARPEGPPLQWFREEIQVEKIQTETIYYHRLNRR